MYLKNSILENISKSTLSNTTLPLVIKFSDKKDNNNYSISYPGTISNGGLVYSFERNSTSNFSEIYNLIIKYKAPEISSKKIFSLYNVFEINDYGSQAMSYGMYDFVTYCFSGGLKIPQSNIAIIRSFTTKKAYVLIEGDKYKNLTKIDILINYKRLHNTYSNSNFNFTLRDGRYYLNLKTLLGYISGNYINNIRIRVTENGKTYTNYNHNSLFVDMKINDQDITEYVSRQINLSDTRGSNIDYFKLLLYIMSGIDLDGSSHNFTETEMELSFRNIFNSESIQCSLYIQDEHKNYYSGKTQTAYNKDISNFNNVSEYKVFELSNGFYKYIKPGDALTYTNGYEIIPNFNSATTAIIESSETNLNDVLSGLNIWFEVL